MPEKSVRTIKDITISTVHSVPYGKMPLLIIDTISEQAQSMLNDLPSKTGFYTTLPEINII